MGVGPDAIIPDRKEGIGRGNGEEKKVETSDVSEDPAEWAAAAFHAGIRCEESFEVIIKSYYDPVMGFFAKRVFSREDCKELTQDVFLRVYRGLSGFRGEARFRTWLFRIAHNTFLKWLRGRRKAETDDRETATRSSRSQPPAMEEQRPVVAAPETQLEELLQRERLQILRAAIAELPAQMQECIKLRIYQDCSYQEIADFKRLSIETVKVHLHRARKTLRKKLAEHFQDIEL